MKVLELKTKQIIEINESYGLRLIEQNKAILPPVSPKMEKESRKKGDA